MDNTGYLPTEKEGRELADVFDFPDVDKLRYGINNAFIQIGSHENTKESLRDPAPLIQQLHKQAEALHATIAELGDAEMRPLEKHYNGDVDNFIGDISDELPHLITLTSYTLSDLQPPKKVFKHSAVWSFIWLLADLWKAEIKEKPKCNYSIVKGDTGKFYNFVMACTTLNNGSVSTSGGAIKKVLKEWYKTNPM